MMDDAISWNDSSLNSTEKCMWCLSEELIGPLIALFTGIIFILSLVTNLFICIYTLRHPKSLKKSSTIFLFNLALVNLLMTVLFMPFMVVASAAEEWIIGQTHHQRDVICQITGYNFAYTVGISVHTLAAISFDRFLSIVKPHQHKKYMTRKVALGIIVFIWIYSTVLDITPFFGFGKYTWAGGVGTCLPIWVGHRDYVIFFSVLSTIPFTIIIVTTTWTYIFTRNFLKKDFERRQTMSTNKEDKLHEKSVYSVRIRNLIGIFGMLLLFNVITFSPYIIASIIGLIVGLKKIPNAAYTAALILFLFNNVTNSVIQSYFRHDLRDAIKKHSRKLAYLIRKSWRKKGINKTLANHADKHIEVDTLDHMDHSTFQNQDCTFKERISETVEVSFESQTIMSTATEINGINSGSLPHKDLHMTECDA